MRFEILKDGEVINVIIADEAFCAAYCAERGLTYRAAPLPEPLPQPTQLNRVEAQSTYTAMMTDTLLEE